jgi:hypothetical protein
MLGYEFEIIYKKREEICGGGCTSKERRILTMKAYFALFPLYTLIGWKKLGHDGKRIKNHRSSFNKYKGPLCIK